MIFALLYSVNLKSEYKNKKKRIYLDYCLK